MIAAVSADHRRDGHRRVVRAARLIMINGTKAATNQTTWKMVTREPGAFVFTSNGRHGDRDHHEAASDQQVDAQRPAGGEKRPRLSAAEPPAQGRPQHQAQQDDDDRRAARRRWTG